MYIYIIIVYIYIVCRKLNNSVERILKCVQDKDRRRVTRKVSCLPLSTEQDVQNFENVDDEIYEEIVSLNIKMHRFLINKFV